MGDAYIGTGDDETAESYYLICLEFNPNHKKYLLALENYYIAVENYHKAEECIKKCLINNDKKEALTLLPASNNL